MTHQSSENTKSTSSSSWEKPEIRLAQRQAENRKPKTENTLRMSADELRKLDESAEDIGAMVERKPIYIIAENVYDTYNIGGLFRLADALAASGLYLCGECETPPNHRIKKASIGTHKIVPWKYFENTKEAIEELRSASFPFAVSSSALPEITSARDEYEDTKPKTGNLSRAKAGQKPETIQVIAVEQAQGSVDYREIEYRAPVALIVGNETFGVTPETLALCDAIAEIPMWGINKSLNVIVSCAIVSYHAASRL